MFDRIYKMRNYRNPWQSTEITVMVHYNL